MAKDWLEIAQSVVDGAGALGKAHPATMKAFSGLGAAAYPDGVLSKEIKELIALVIGVVVRCDGCVGYHAKAAVEKGVTREQLAEALSVAIQMGGGPSMVYGAQALEAYDQHYKALKG